MAKLIHNSGSFLVFQAIRNAMVTVGKIILIPNSFHSIIQQVSLISQSGMWMFSNFFKSLKLCIMPVCLSFLPEIWVDYVEYGCPIRTWLGLKFLSIGCPNRLRLHPRHCMPRIGNLRIQRYRGPVGCEMVGKLW